MENILYRRDLPRHFCREFAQIRGHSTQAAMYMALILGFKPLMDDWVDIDRLAEFKKACRKYKIHAREDAIFKHVIKDTIPLNVLGREYLTTTSSYGFPIKSGAKGQAHVFLSMDKELLKKGMWYPLITKNRVIFPPRADILKYGYVLGYPDCCIKFYKKYNLWTKYSHLFEAYKNTTGRPSFLCNPFLKETSFSYIYHMPCSYDCEKTIKLAGALRQKIKVLEPEYVEQADRYLKMPCLVLYERVFYCFEGIMKNYEIKYKKAYFLSHDKEKDVYGKMLEKADTLRLEGRKIVLSRGNKVFKEIEVKLESFAPKMPFLIDFCG